MKTIHSVFFQNASRLDDISSNSIDLVVTSPPYPMIEMWDDVFSSQNGRISGALKKQGGSLAFELMHQELDKVWNELWRVLKKGGIACVNIGDATRTINGHFAIYTNHARILMYMQKIGFSGLPTILWRKQTNAPNKFMGSGMLPPGAYVTLEHEYILVLRKGNKKEFKTEEEKKIRRESAYFWEERNLWFSDVWMDLKGTSQKLFENEVRARSAAFPFELPYRLINMFSVKGDTVLDPFLGVGTTLYAAMAASRNSVGYEIDSELRNVISSKMDGIKEFANTRISQRLKNHIAFVKDRVTKKGKFKHTNKHYLFPVMTNQETDLLFNSLISTDQRERDVFEASYAVNPQNDFVCKWEEYVMSDSEKQV